MSFNDLPPELLAIIVTHLRRPDQRLSTNVTLSLGFRNAIENVLFSTLRISNFDFDDFEQIVRPQLPGRRDFLRTLIVDTILPTYSNVQCALFERASDKQLNNRTFSRSIIRLFSLLSQCNHDAPVRPFTLQFDQFYSPMDGGRRPTYAQDYHDEGILKRKDLFDKRYQHSYLDLLQDELSDLPAVPCVTTLKFQGGCYRLVAPAVAAILASKLSCLQTIDWIFNDEERRYPKMRADLRREFARHLVPVRSASVHNFRLDYMCDSPFNEGFRNANLLGDDTVDPLSIRLGRYLQTYNLVWIHLTGPICLGPEFFWADEDGKKWGLATSWPALKIFELELSSVRPDGGYYFQRDPRVIRDDEDEDELPDIDNPLSDSSSDDVFLHGSDDSFDKGNEHRSIPDEYDYEHEERHSGQEPTRLFRALPTPELEEFLEAAAGCAIHMPLLEKFSARFKVSAPEQQFGFEFVTCRPQGPAGMESDDSQRNRLMWTVSRDWRMNPTIETIWAGALGEKGIVEYEEWFVEEF